MTEAEAKTKWCPFARAISGDDEPAAVNRQSNIQSAGAPDRDCLCLASGCMAWRVSSPLTPDDGYCGLAGQPAHFTVREDD